MAWTAPRTWVASETVTSALMNTHVRDNLNILKTCVSSLGIWLPAVKTHSYTSGQGNGAGAVDTALTNYDVTIPANTLNTFGAGLVVTQYWAYGGGSTAGYGKVSFDGGTTKVTLWGINSASTYGVWVRYTFMRRSSSAGIVIGTSAYTTGTTGGALCILATTGTMTWTNAITLKNYGNHATANAAFLYYQQVEGWELSNNGAAV